MCASHPIASWRIAWVLALTSCQHTTPFAAPGPCPEMTRSERAELIQVCEITKPNEYELRWNACPELKHWFTRWGQHCAADDALRE